MFRKPLTSVLILAFAIAPLFVSADTLSDLQIQVQQLQSRIATLQSQSDVPKTVIAATAPSSSCVSLYSNLYQGKSDTFSNGDVTRLQQFLGVTPTTGYFGPLTLRAVQQWQSAHGIVSSGKPSTTGYGFVGSMTRAAMKCSNSSAQSTTSNIITATTPTITTTQASVQVSAPVVTTVTTPNVNTAQTKSSGLSVSATSGVAPLTVTFSGVGNSITFGDGTTLGAVNNDVIGSIVHTYGSDGTFTATSNGSSVSIVVMGGTQASVAIDQNSMNASANTSFVLAGSASSAVHSVSVSLMQGTKSYSQSVVPVTSGKWQKTITNGLPVGNYNVCVSGFYDAAGTMPIDSASCTTGGILTVVASTVTGPSATLDQSSLTSSGLLSGTASYVNVIAIDVVSSSGESYGGPSQVINGGNRWQVTERVVGAPGVERGIAPGTYLIRVYDFSSGLLGALLTSGNVTFVN